MMFEALASKETISQRLHPSLVEYLPLSDKRWRKGGLTPRRFPPDCGYKLQTMEISCPAGGILHSPHHLNNLQQHRFALQIFCQVV